ncbi:terminase gpA endonuclease subunit [Sphingobium sp.]|uniref:terminase gpA endonuclease subunit n=1 Tax=Sphingobium sp. TaxID=1912891 RepID=UPI0039C946C4
MDQTCPLRALLTVGIDVARDRFEVEVVGWSDKGERWSLASSRFVNGPQGTPGGSFRVLPGPLSQRG